MTLHRGWKASLTLLLLLALFPPAGAALAEGATPASPPAFASPLFAQTWARSDQPVAQNAVARSWLWGPAPGATLAEPFAGAPGGTLTVQYFDKARMELNPAVSDPTNPWAVTTGLLVVELVSGQVQTGPNNYETRAPAEVPVAGDSNPAPDLAAGVPVYRSFQGVASLPGGPDRSVPAATGAPVLATIDRAGTVGALPSSDVHYATYSAPTGHNIPDVFARYLSSQGLVYENGALRQDTLFDPVYVLGYPISEAYWATVPIAGQPTRVLIQLYQRRVLTYIPSYTADWQVQMGNVGQHYYAWRYGQSQAQPPATIPTPNPQPPTPAPLPPAPSGDAFVHIAGNQLVYAGQPVLLKGTNYWTSSTPFVGTWAHWNGPLVQRELEKAHELGVNTIRVGIPYDHSATLQIIWGEGCDKKGANCTQVHGWIANQMTQLLQIASVYGMKVIFTLFDWSDSFPAPNTAEYRKEMNYLQGIVAPFANDDRVLAWDLHNEPENYTTWQSDQARLIAWTANMSAAVHSLDSHHPVTIGAANEEDLWVEAGGRRMIDSVDFVSFHCYSAGDLRTQINAITARTTKPVLLEEMGWPTGPAEQSTPAAHYDEATQEFLYHSMLNDAKASSLVGVVQWTLWDYTPGSSNGGKGVSFEEWFGLVRLDGSFKPAAADFRDRYPVRLLPSLTATNVPLTKTPGDSRP